MSVITNEQILNELDDLKQQMRQVQEAVSRFRFTKTLHPHIIQVEGVQGGEPIVRNAYVSVRTIVEQSRLGTTPEELVKGYPPLTLAEIHDALSYCYDHTDEIESIIARHDTALERGKEFITRNVPPKSKSL